MDSYSAYTPEQMTFNDYTSVDSISQNKTPVNGKAAETAEHPNIRFDNTLIYDNNSKTVVGANLRTLQDLNTGQIINVQQITKRAVGQKMFWKLYLSDFLNILGILESKQVDVLIYILDNTSSSTNTFLGTYRKIAEGSGVSLETARRVMKKLQDNGFIKKIQNGAYFISPKILMRGDERKKSILLDYYYSVGNEHEDNTEKP